MSQKIDTPTQEIPANLQTIVLAGGCFWGTQAYLNLLDGVFYTDVGYANSRQAHPSYAEVCKGETGAAEAVRVIYDPEILPLGNLLFAYLLSIDPYSLNQQGNDKGEQYRTGIYWLEEDTAHKVERFSKTLAAHSPKALQVETLPLESFYRAEPEHQHYLEHHPDGYCHIHPNLMRELKEKGIKTTFNLNAWGDYIEDRYRVNQDILEVLPKLHYEVTQNGATEKPFSSSLNQHTAKGLYVDITTGEPLFLSLDKFDAGCGWPSFTTPVVPEVLTYHPDQSQGMNRIEVRSRGGNAHLGHVFPDGPVSGGGLRYCINGAALRFIPYEELEKEGYGAFLSYFETIKKEG